jgi:hypothetical protein
MKGVRVSPFFTFTEIDGTTAGAIRTPRGRVRRWRREHGA